MKVRCDVCGFTYDSEASERCPQCGSANVIPYKGALRADSYIPRKGRLIKTRIVLFVLSIINGVMCISRVLTSIYALTKIHGAASGESTILAERIKEIDQSHILIFAVAIFMLLYSFLGIMAFVRKNDNAKFKKFALLSGIFAICSAVIWLISTLLGARSIYFMSADPWLIVFIAMQAFYAIKAYLTFKRNVD